jgi:hypothetical protein
MAENTRRPYLVQYTWLQTRLLTREAITKLDWTVLSTYHKVKIWPAKLHLFHPVKNAIHEDQFREHGKLIKEVKMWF